LMLTNPNTLGLFEKNILEISHLVHKMGHYYMATARTLMLC